MARRLRAGFEDQGTDLFDGVVGASVVASAGLDMDGGYCLECTGASDYVSRTIAADTEDYSAMLVRLPSLALTQVLGYFTGSTLLGNVAIDATGRILAYAGDSTLLATSDNTLSAATTYRIETWYKIADSPDGRIKVKVNGLTYIDFTGDTKPGADASFTAFRAGYCGVSGRNANAYYDNIILDDSAWIGNTKIQALTVTGAGTTTQFTPSAGANYECVDEVPASDTDYNSSNTVDHLDTFAMSNLTGTIISVLGVQVQARCWAEGAPTPTSLKPAIRSGGTDYVGTAAAVGSTPTAIFYNWDLDPATSAAFIEAGVNALEAGYKSAA